MPNPCQLCIKATFTPAWVIELALDAIHLRAASLTTNSTHDATWALIESTHAYLNLHNKRWREITRTPFYIPPPPPQEFDANKMLIALGLLKPKPTIQRRI